LYFSDPVTFVALSALPLFSSSVCNLFFLIHILIPSV
jgi:hypothetical protein